MRKKALEKQTVGFLERKKKWGIKSVKAIVIPNEAISNTEEFGKLLFCSKMKASNVCCWDWQTTSSSGVELFKLPELRWEHYHLIHVGYARQEIHEQVVH